MTIEFENCSRKSVTPAGRTEAGDNSRFETPAQENRFA
jgi:hypothetical protein